MSTKIPTQLGSFDTVTFLELSLIVQVLGLVLQHLMASRFIASPAAELFYALSVSNLAILVIRYLSGESENRKKLKILSAVIQGLLLGSLVVLPVLALPFVPEPSNGRFLTVILMVALGGMFEIATETQKKVIICYNGRKLTTDGMFKYVRHPELIGAVVRYSAFLVLAQIKYFYLISGVFALFLIPLQVKLRNEKLSQKEGWADYEKRTYALLPKFSNNDIVNIGLVVALAISLVFDYSVGGFIQTLKGLKLPGGDL